MDVYAPLAHRLGMQKIKWELEDTALRYLAPMEYNEIMSYLQAHKEKDEAFMRTIQDKITQRLTSVGIHNTTYGRIKHVYSIYRKMLAQGKTIDELIKMVSSPGGTTLAGLDGLYQGKLTDVVKDCCERCTKRAYELSK